MRHNEAQARLFAGAMGQIVGNMGETIERQKIEIDKTDAMRSKPSRVENIISNDHQRKLEMTKEMNRAAKVQQLVGFAFDMAPTIANRVMGKPIFKEVARNPTKLSSNGSWPQSPTSSEKRYSARCRRSSSPFCAS